MADTISDNTALSTGRTIQGTAGIQTFTNSGSDTGFSIDASDQNDYFKFTVSRSSNVVLKLLPQGGDLSLSLLNASGNDNDLATVLSSTNNPDGMAEAIVSDPIAPLEAGQTYYIRVSGNSPTTTINYTLSIETNPTSRADLLWRNYDGNSTGANLIWRMDGTSIAGTQSVLAVSPNWALQAAGDFDGDGNADYLWHDSGSGTLLLWLMDATGGAIRATTSIVPFPLSYDFYVGGLGDFNQDGSLDIVWRSRTSAYTAVWYMDRTAYASGATIDYLPGADWVIEAVSDFNLDGKPDFFYRNTQTGQNTYWLMDGIRFKSAENLITVGGAWRMEGAGDFDGDGDADLVWRDYAGGGQLVWFMNQTQYVSAVSLLNVPTTWAIASVLTNALPPDLAGNAKDAAFATGLLKSTAAYSDTLGPADTDEYYSFTLDVASKVSVKVNGSNISGTSTLQIFSAADELKGTATANGADETKLTDALLDPGTYYVKLATTSKQDILYNLELSAQQQVLPVNLFFPPVTAPDKVTQLKKVDGTPFDSTTPVSVATPFTFDLDYKVTYGDRELSQFEVGFYLSKNGTLDNDDLRLDVNGDSVGDATDVVVISNTTPNTVIQRTQRLTLPDRNSPFWINDGLYSILVVLDPANKITETKPSDGTPAEGDNVFATELKVRDARSPDITGTLNVVEDQVQKGGVITLTGLVQNIGAGVSDSQLPIGSKFEVTFYLSKDNIFDNNDFALDPLLEFDPLDPEASQNFPQTGQQPIVASVPQNWSEYDNLDGIYYVLMVIDELGTLKEEPSDTTNNVVFDTVRIVNPLA